MIYSLPAEYRQRIHKEPQPQEEPANTLVPHGEMWKVVFNGKEGFVRDSKGIRCIYELLRAPNQEFPVLTLERIVSSENYAPVNPSHLEDFGSQNGNIELADEKAIKAYKAKLDEIESELEEAREFGDLGREASLNSDKEKLVEHLKSVTGLGNGARKVSGPKEKARKKISKAIHTVIKNIWHFHPDLATHLQKSLSLGFNCQYNPEVPVDWILEKNELLPQK